MLPMWNGNDAVDKGSTIAQARYDELKRDAAVRECIETASGADQTNSYNPILVWLGGWLVRVGLQLQARYGQQHTPEFEQFIVRSQG